MERLTIEKIKSLKEAMRSNMNVYFYDDVMKVFDELLEKRNAEEQGLLLRLPCKVGDTVYHIEDGYIYEFKAKSIDIRKEADEYIYCIDSMDYRKEHFGKIAFLTLEEAEAALARMEKENG